jgi:two-component system nitrogen regulation sensor histidine kinase GlnL
VDCSITPVHDAELAQGVLIELIQIDQHLRITREENLLLQQQTVRNIIRGLAHEIKNPLGGIRGAAQLLARELTSDQHREYTDIIISEADRLQSLLNRMLVPNSLPHKRWTNIHRVLMRVSQLITSEVGTELEMFCDFDPSIPELLADADQLLQAVLNVVRNAVQAIGGKGVIKMRTRVQRQITLGRKRHKLVIRIDIIDHGPGIPANIIDQVFYPLVTSRAEGSGLGLSIAQSLINQHQGLIECSSQPGETIFTLWLPVTE